MNATILTVEGMVCGGCANAVKTALGSLEGVTNVAVDLAAKRVAVDHDDRATRDQLAVALQRAGFQSV